MPKIKCPQCFSEYEIEKSLFGETLECPECGNKFNIPNPERNSVLPTAKTPSLFMQVFKIIGQILVFLFILLCLVGNIIGRGDSGIVAVVIMLAYIYITLLKICKKLDD